LYDYLEKTVRPAGEPPLLFLFSLSNVLQAYAIDRTRKAIHALMKLRPDKALTRRDGNIVVLPIEQLSVGDIVIISPGEGIPLDSMIVVGSIPFLETLGGVLDRAPAKKLNALQDAGKTCVLVGEMSEDTVRHGDSRCCTHERTTCVTFHSRFP
jgi:hypothetical protein